MQDLKDLKSRFFQKRFRRCEGDNPANPKSGHLCRKTCRDVFIVDVTLQILIQTVRGIAGDRPPRYGNRTVSFLTEKRPLTVGRGPVPRHAPVHRKLAGDRPPRYGIGAFFFAERPPSP